MIAVEKISWQATGDSQYQLSGSLERDTVPEFWRSRNKWMPNDKQVSLDLSALTRVDSAGMVMILHLCHQLSSSGCNFKLLNVPEQLKTLLRLSHVEPMLAAYME